jgi:MFS family permease
MRYRNYILVVLSAIAGLIAAETSALGLVAQALKHDFSLTDTELGLLTGFAFALFYALAGLAIARWADRGDRVAIISLSMTAWGILLAACGAATSFLQILLLRVGIGIGEAGCVPVIQSLIADNFNRVERLRANALFFALVTGINELVGFAVAGWLNEVYGWRVMFVSLGLPGLAIAILAWFSLREPRREGVCNSILAAERGTFYRRKARTGAPAPARLTKSLTVLWSNTTFRRLMLFWTVWAFVNLGLFRWMAVYFVRRYGLHTGELGVWFACVFGVCGVVAPLIGGAWSSRYAANNEPLQLRVVAAICCVLSVLSPFIYLVHNHYFAFGLLGAYATLSNMFIGTLYSILQTIVPEAMRASATAILMLMANLIGDGLGPLATGALSDLLSVRFGEESLIYASLAMCPGFVLAAWCLWQASHSVGRDLAATQVVLE